MPREYPSTIESAGSRLLKLEKKQLRGFRKLTVVGDLHGDYCTLLSALRLVDLEKEGIIFLGDYAGRGIARALISHVSAIKSLSIPLRNQK